MTLLQRFQILPHALKIIELRRHDLTLQGVLQHRERKRDARIYLRLVCAILSGVVVPDSLPPTAQRLTDAERWSEWLLIQGVPLPTRAEIDAAEVAISEAVAGYAGYLSLVERAEQYRRLWRSPAGGCHLQLVDAGMLTGQGLDLVCSVFPDTDRQAVAVALHGLRGCDELSRTRGQRALDPAEIDRGLAMGLTGCGSAPRDAWALKAAETEALKKASK